MNVSFDGVRPNVSRQRAAALKTWIANRLVSATSPPGDSQLSPNPDRTTRRSRSPPQGSVTLFNRVALPSLPRTTAASDRSSAGVFLFPAGGVSDCVPS
jgi:hypothetical protein